MKVKSALLLSLASSTDSALHSFGCASDRTSARASRCSSRRKQRLFPRSVSFQVCVG